MQTSAGGDLCCCVSSLRESGAACVGRAAVPVHGLSPNASQVPCSLEDSSSRRESLNAVMQPAHAKKMPALHALQNDLAPATWQETQERRTLPTALVLPAALGFARSSSRSGLTSTNFAILT